MQRLRVHGMLVASALMLSAGCRRTTVSGEDGSPQGGGGHQGGSVGAAGAAAGTAGGTGGAGTGGPSAGGAGAGGAGAGGGSTGTDCGTVNISARMTIPPNILILLDASGSMNENADNMPCDGGCGATSKWAQASTALRSIVSETETSVNWGLELWPDLSGGGSACSVRAGSLVAVAARNAAAVTAAITARSNASGGINNGGNTPTRAAVENGARTLGALAGGGGRKLILLVTDGAPNCAPQGLDVDDSTGAVQAVADAFSSGLPTIVVGIATAGGPADATLAKMAVAGGFARTDVSPAYYPAASISELTDTLRSLVLTVVDCVYALPTGPGSSPGDITVRVDGVDVPRDANHANGWDYTDSSQSSVQIHGAVCSDLMAGRITTVTIASSCPDTD